MLDSHASTPRPCAVADHSSTRVYRTDVNNQVRRHRAGPDEDRQDGRVPLPRRAALVLAAPWAGWAVVRSTGADRGFPLVPAAAFTRYAAATSVLPLAVGVLARSRSATGLAAGAAAVLGGSVLSGVRRTPGGPTDGPPLRLVSLNMLHGRADSF
jgi:hypothetical protein